MQRRRLDSAASPPGRASALLALGVLAGLASCGPQDLSPAGPTPAAPRVSSDAGCAPSAGSNDAAFVSQNVPRQVAAGSRFLVQVTMRIPWAGPTATRG